MALAAEGIKLKKEDFCNNLQSKVYVCSYKYIFILWDCYFSSLWKWHLLLAGIKLKKENFCNNLHLKMFVCSCSVLKSEWHSIWTEHTVKLRKCDSDNIFYEVYEEHIVSINEKKTVRNYIEPLF